MNLKRINELSASEAHEAFLRCCGCERWAKLMADNRPYRSAEHLNSQVQECFASLSKENWLEAFAAHPKIGDLDSLRKKYADTKNWAQGEQSGVSGTSSEVLHKLASGNKLYEENFGYIFIVCATGKSAEEMLSILESRVHNPPAQEFPIACEEQKKITLLRLEKLE